MLATIILAIEKPAPGSNRDGLKFVLTTARPAQKDQANAF